MRPFILLLAFLSFACTQTIQEETVESFSDGSPQKVNHYILDGEDKVIVETVDYYPNGQIKMRGPLNENGERDGVWKAWYQDGTIWSEGSFKDGLQDGCRKVYHPNGQRRYTGEYDDDRPSGQWVFYDDQGNEINKKNYE